MFIRKIGCTFSDGSESFVYISCLSFILCMENIKYEGILNGKETNGGTVPDTFPSQIGFHKHAHITHIIQY